MASDIGDALTSTARAFTRVAGRSMPSGVTALHAAVLTASAANPGQSGRALARAVDETPQTTHDALAALARAGYIERLQSEKNARVRETRLTPSGRDALTSIRKAIKATEKIALAGVTPDEARILAGILRRMEAALNAQDQQPTTRPLRAVREKKSAVG